MLQLQFISRWPRVILLLALAGCGGGGGGGGGNQSPVASFTMTPASGQVPLAVAFDASGSSDPDGSIASYSWTFGDGQSGAGATASHTYQTAGTFTASLTVTDNRGATGRTSRTVTVDAQPPPPFVTVSGRISFERVPFLPPPQQGLNYPGTFSAPAREIEVELLRASTGDVLATTATDANGDYSVSAPSQTDVRLRAKALSRFSATSNRPAAWDIRVLNNTNGNALYVLDGAVFNSGAAAQTRNLLATTGWGGTFAGVYTGVRAAAPFAVLDTLYAAAQFVIARGDPAIQLPPLAAYWSGDNRPCDGCAFHPGSGDIQTTQFVAAGPAPGMYVLGLASNDTDEFDQHVLAHEFQHYLEDAVSRTDTVGGAHSLGERLDPRVAFSEGYANAFSAMALADPLYRDSFGTAQGSDFGFDLESDAANAPGWYSEDSVHRIVWDLYDTANDAADVDAVALGYGPLHDVMRTELRNGVPLTSIFPLVTALKQRPSAPVAAIDARVAAERVAGTSMGIDALNMDAYATTETHSGVAATSADLVLPVYASLTMNGPSVRLCAAAELTAPDGTTIAGTYNKLGNRRFLRFAVPSSRTIDIRVSCGVADATCAGAPVPDPDFVLRRGSTIEVADSSVPNVELLQISAEAGDYVLEIYEFSHIDSAASSRRGRTCMTVTITG